MNYLIILCLSWLVLLVTDSPILYVLFWGISTTLWAITPCILEFWSNLTLPKSAETIGFNRMIDFLLAEFEKNPQALANLGNIFRNNGATLEEFSQLVNNTQWGHALYGVDTEKEKVDYDR